MAIINAHRMRTPLVALLASLAIGLAALAQRPTPAAPTRAPGTAAPARPQPRPPARSAKQGNRPGPIYDDLGLVPGTGPAPAPATTRQAPPANPAELLPGPDDSPVTRGQEAPPQTQAPRATGSEHARAEPPPATRPSPARIEPGAVPVVAPRTRRPRPVSPARPPAASRAPSPGTTSPASTSAVPSGAADAAAPQTGATAPASVTAPPPKILTPNLDDAGLRSLFAKWRGAVANLHPSEAEALRKQLLSAKADLGAEDLEIFSAAFVRASGTRMLEKDQLGAIVSARTAVDLAPDFPYAHWGLAKAYFNADPWSVGRVLSELKAAIGAAISDPRYARPLAADLGTLGLVALLATAVLAILVLFLRHVRYFLHDFHHLFPKAAHRWQSFALAALLLCLPLVFRVGVACVLLAFFAASVLYLAKAEKAVAVVCIALVGVIPNAAGWIAAHTAFAGTVAEKVYLLERGGIAAAPSAREVGASVADGSATFEELFALGRYDLHRGETASAVPLFKKAAAMRNNDARLLTNLGNALLTKGDVGGAAELYQNATQVNPGLAAAFYDLGRLTYRRAATANEDALGPELDKAQNAIATAQRIDPSLLNQKPPPEDHYLANLLLLSPGLSMSEISALAFAPSHGEAITAQISERLLGAEHAAWAPFYPLAFALLLLGFAALRKGRGPCGGCEKCGRPVCRKCDPELGVGSRLCNQCVHVFARKGQVDGAVKVRKQIEVRRWRERRNRLAFLFSAVCSGLGHLFGGWPVRGALYAFVFLFGICAVFLRHGVLRPPFGWAPVWLSALPAVLLVAFTYLLTLRGLWRRSSE